LGKTIWHKTESYWEQLQERFGNLGTLRELDGNTLRTMKKYIYISLFPPPPQKEKNWTVHECMLSLPIEHCKTKPWFSCKTCHVQKLPSFETHKSVDPRIQQQTPTFPVGIQAHKLLAAR